MTDDEIDTLAKDILTKIIGELDGRAGAPKYFQDVQERESGELVPVYAGTSTKGYGSFSCEYMLLAAVKTVIVDCARMFDDYTVIVTDTQTEQSVKRKISEGRTPVNRDSFIRVMAERATLRMVTSFRGRLAEVMTEVVNDATLIAKSTLAALVGTLGTLLSEDVPDNLTADLRAEIEEAAKRVAENKRALLRRLISGPPHIIAERGPGAPAKSRAEREREGKDYTARVEDAYRKLRAELGRTPTKTSVAKELGEGGVNPRKGSDTSLSAFGNKLRRLKVDYDAIAKKVEDELNNNS